MAKKITPAQAGPASRFESEGRDPEKPKSREELLSHPPSDNFLLMAHPRNWQVINGELLPKLKPFWLVPGINGVRDNKDETNARNRASRKKFVIIEQNAYPGVTSYIKEHECQKGKLHTTIWEKPVESAGGPIIKRDEAGYLRFLRWIKEELLPPPEPEHLGRLADMYQARIEDRATRALTSPAVAKKNERDQKDLDLLLSAQAAIEEGGEAHA